MTDFTAATTATGVADPTTVDFTNPDANSGRPADSGVVLEIKGRKMSQAEIEKQLGRLDDKDNFIEQLKAERVEDRRQLSEALELLKQAAGVERLAAAAAKPNAEAPKDAGNAALDPDALVDRTVNAIAERQKKADVTAKSDANFAEVTSELTKRFGAKVNEKVAEVAAANDLTVQDAAALARKSPKAFLALFPKPAATPTPLKGTLNPVVIPGQQRQPNADLFKAGTVNDQVAIYRDRLAAKIAALSN